MEWPAASVIITALFGVIVAIYRTVPQRTTNGNGNGNGYAKEADMREATTRIDYLEKSFDILSGRMDRLPQEIARAIKGP